MVDYRPIWSFARYEAITSSFGDKKPDATSRPSNMLSYLQLLQIISAALGCHQIGRKTPARFSPSPLSIQEGNIATDHSKPALLNMKTRSRSKSRHETNRRLGQLEVDVRETRLVRSVSRQINNFLPNPASNAIDSVPYQSWLFRFWNATRFSSDHPQTEQIRPEMSWTWMEDSLF